MRHAEAQSDWTGAADIDRPLTTRGHIQARTMGNILIAHTLQTILCSSAQRTQETLESMKLCGLHAPREIILNSLYHATPDQICDEILAHEAAGNLLIIAHNPGIHQLAFAMAKDGKPELLNRLSCGYPPATLSILEGQRLIDLLQVDEADHAT